MIGVFDSGLGGLTILKQFFKKLPQYNYIYLGDNARAPYGSKSEEVIYNYACQAVDFLFKQGCELIIFACNTVSAEALPKIQQEYLPKKYPDKKVLGVIIPAAEEATTSVIDKYKIGVIGTRATINSGAHEKEIRKRINTDTEIISLACPLLVPLIEEGWTNNIETKMILKKYLHALKLKQINALILGCTHYPFLLKDIKRIMGEKVKIINTPEVTADKLIDYLNRHPEIKNKLNKNQKRFFFTTDAPEKFKELGSKFLGESIKGVKKIVLE
jgi:glutamate racemase